jgi:putative ABC transport system ATP-binding protein
MEEEARLHAGGGRARGGSVHSEMSGVQSVLVEMVESRREGAEGGGAAGAEASAPRAVEEDLDDAEAPPRKDEVLKARRVFKTYLLGKEGVSALRGVSLTVKEGEFVCILGKSGSGKSTLLHCLGGIDLPTRGDIFVAGTRMDARTPDATLARLRRDAISVVFQSFNLVRNMTAVENVELPMVLSGRGTARTRRDRALALLRRVGLGHRGGHVPSQLSGGEQQRVAIARALANSPQILLLDEPTGDLDGANTAIVMRLLTSLSRERHTTVVMVTHDVGLRHFADRVVHMLDGKIVAEEAVPRAERSRVMRELDEHPAVRAMEEAIDAERGAERGTEPPATGAAGASGTGTGTGTGRGAAGASGAGPGHEATARLLIVRQPGDYASIRFARAQAAARRAALGATPRAADDADAPASAAAAAAAAAGDSSAGNSVLYDE